MKTIFTTHVLRIILICLHPVLFSCATKKAINKNLNYADSPNRQLWSVDWSPDDKFIAVGGVDSVVRIYRSNNLKLYKSFSVDSWIHVVKWNSDNKTLAVATLDKGVLLLNLETESVIILPGHGGSRAIDWNYNGELLAVGDLDGRIKIWDKNGKLVKSFDKQYDPDIAGRSYLGLDWHPARNIFVATNFQIHLFDSTATELKVMEHTNKQAIILCINWHPSGEFFVIGDYGHNWEGENVPSLLHFWSKDGKYLKSVPGSKKEYRNISWNREGTLLATASDVLRIWSDDGSLLHESKVDSTNYLWGIDWNSIGSRIVTSSRFQTISLWDSGARLIKRIDIGN
jgi:WD40 repeat protein